MIFTNYNESDKRNNKGDKCIDCTFKSDLIIKQ